MSGYGGVLGVPEDPLGQLLRGKYDRFCGLEERVERNSWRAWGQVK